MQRLCGLNARIIRRHRRTPTEAATGTRRRQTSAGTLLNQPPLELGQCREDVEDQLAAGRRGVNRAVAQRLEPDAPLPEVFDDVDEVANRPPEAVKPPDDEGVAGLQMLQASVEAGADGL